jgi:hypothetical protein
MIYQNDNLLMSSTLKGLKSAWRPYYHNDKNYHNDKKLYVFLREYIGKALISNS